MKWKKSGRKGRDLIEILSRHLIGGTEESHENLSRYPVCSRNWNPASPCCYWTNLFFQKVFTREYNRALNFRKAYVTIFKNNINTF
jgi:hypothetical protein